VIARRFDVMARLANRQNHETTATLPAYVPAALPEQDPAPGIIEVATGPDDRLLH
jgi:hypothetical protein